MPTFKLKNKIQIKSRTKRIYDKPVTPYRKGHDIQICNEGG
jgi:hypothetical protein